MSTRTGAPKFPLARGWYFGWRHAPSESVSGFHGFREFLLVWQERMIELGYEIKADGFYGQETRDAARDLQQKRGLKVDGKIGRTTWDATWQD